ncbi:MAG TPA: HNH endonuclease family protein, partial [Dehalococcoidia bacterium]|nr:HNH endonuclease family protein [Dehalococcoidia bacterium]
DQLLADRRRNAVTQIAQARMVATAVYLRPDFTKDEKAKILRRWENVTFRIYGMFMKDARTAVGDYVRLAWSIVRGGLSADQVLERLSSIGAGFPIARAVENLRETDCYTGWREELRYFFHRYEEHLARKAGQNFNNEQWNRIWQSSAADSIEHIRPQSYWASLGLEPDPDDVHRLGNLLILPPKLNSRLGAKAPEEKADEYRKTGLLLAQEVAERLHGWSFEATKERENALLEWALREWAD